MGNRNSKLVDNGALGNGVTVDRRLMHALNEWASVVEEFDITKEKLASYTRRLQIEYRDSLRRQLKASLLENNSKSGS